MLTKGVSEDKRAIAKEGSRVDVLARRVARYDIVAVAAHRDAHELVLHAAGPGISTKQREHVKEYSEPKYAHWVDVENPEQPALHAVDREHVAGVLNNVRNEERRKTESMLKRRYQDKLVATMIALTSKFRQS